jgi:hypothetical protein
MANMRSHRVRMITLVILLTVGAPPTVGACDSGTTGTATGQPANRSAGAGELLKGVCPDTVAVQTNWWPQAEYGALYRLLGKDAQVDKGRKSVAGSLVAHGVDTGVKIEIRSGGPANNYTPAAKMLYLDKSITLGGVDLDQAAQLSADQPVQAVFAPLDLSPLVLMWDPATNPNFKTVADIGRTDTRVLYFQGSTYMDYLVGAGILRKTQVEGSYDGTPARFVAENGKVVQQGFLTNEVYQYEHELAQWKKPVGWTLVNDAGYPTYPETFGVRSDRKAELAPCLRALVPMLQRATVDYLQDPAGTNDLIASLVKDFNAFPYTAARAAQAVTVMKNNKIMGNGGNAAVGDFDTSRVSRIIDLVKPIFAAQRHPIRGDLKPEDISTNEFIDPSIGIKS